MAKTKAWVDDQGVWGPKSPTQMTRDWVLEQQLKEAQRIQAEKAIKEKAAERKWWEATVRSIDRQAEIWMAQAEASRQAARREAEKTRRVQEEVRRVSARAEAREAEKRRAREEVRATGEGNTRGRAHAERENAAKTLVNAWTTYENRWATLQVSQGERLTFHTIPWPLVYTPSSPSSISNANIAFFLLSPLHSANKSRRERIREAMQRWHNDKFDPRILPRVIERDRDAVKEGVDVVVRCLNDLLTRQ